MKKFLDFFFRFGFILIENKNEIEFGTKTFQNRFYECILSNRTGNLINNFSFFLLVKELPFFAINPINPNESYGIDGKLFKTLSNYFNFSIQYVAGENFGIQSGPGNFSGVLGKILEEVKFFINLLI